MHCCPLCESTNSESFFQDTRRDYLRCSVCQLVFVPSEQRLSSREEKAEYDKHQNSPDDLGYRRFLSRVSEPLLKQLKKASEGLDFGCGPGPCLSVVMEEQGHRVALFDAFYFPDSKVWHRSYDFITATEVIEHVFEPKKELSRLWSHLRPSGYLALMTKLVIDKEAFSLWHYKNDPTHVCFYSKETLAWLADNWGAKLRYFADDAFIFEKPER